MSNPISGAAVRTIAAQPHAHLVRVEIPFDAHQVSASPHDTTWNWWWAPIMGPTGVVSLGYLHHLNAQGIAVVDLRQVTVMCGISSKAKWGKNHRGIAALGRLAVQRLINVGTAEDGRTVIQLLDPIPRPSNKNLETIERRVKEATK